MDNSLYSKKPPEAQLEEVDEIIRGQSSPARNVWQRIRSYIKNFKSALDNEHETSVYILSSSGNRRLEVDNISYWSPDMLIFECVADNNGETILLQHYSQLNFFLSAKKKNPNHPAKVIGFTVNAKDEETNCDN